LIGGRRVDRLCLKGRLQISDKSFDVVLDASIDRLLGPGLAKERVIEGNMTLGFYRLFVDCRTGRLIDDPVIAFHCRGCIYKYEGDANPSYADTERKLARTGENSRLDERVVKGDVEIPGASLSKV